MQRKEMPSVDMGLFRTAKFEVAGGAEIDGEE